MLAMRRYHIGKGKMRCRESINQYTPDRVYCFGTAG